MISWSQFPAVELNLLLSLSTTTVLSVVQGESLISVGIRCQNSLQVSLQISDDMTGV